MNTIKKNDDVYGLNYKNWVAGLDGNMKDKIKNLQSKDQRWNLILVVFILMWISGAAIVYYSNFWAIDIIGYVLIGLCIHGMANLMHECIHNNLWKKEWQNSLFGFVCGIPSLFSMTSYKVNHLIHHKHTGAEGDPDEMQNMTNNKVILTIFFYLWLFVGIFIYLIHVPFNALKFGNTKERIQIIVEYLIIGAIIATVLFFLNQNDNLILVLDFWLIPMIFGGFLGNVRGWAEHMLTDKDHFLLNTRTVTSTKLFSFLFVNLNYHLEHHLFPKMPWYNLPVLHKMLLPEYKKVNATVYSSYVTFFFDAFRRGPHARI